jgi:hypothetical protein
LAFRATDKLQHGWVLPTIEAFKGLTHRVCAPAGPPASTRPIHDAIVAAVSKIAFADCSSHHPRAALTWNIAMRSVDG